jgi:hypothetical protein
MLGKGDHVPGFEIVTIDDIRVNYADLWQKKNLALVCLSEDDSADAQGYIQQLREALPALAVHDAVVVVTTNAVEGMPLPGCAVADRWGELQWIMSSDKVADLPSPREIAAWLQFVEIQCPECEGEVH